MSDKKVVMIVDDEEDAIEIAQIMLSEVDGIETISASSGDEALEKVASTKVDMIILDVQMPGKNGFDVFAELKKSEATSSIPVVMLTAVKAKTGVGFSSDEMGDFLGAKPEVFIEKPVDAAELQATVKKLLSL